MKRIQFAAVAVVGALVLGGFIPVFADSSTSGDNGVEVKTRGGFEVKTKDGEYSLSIGGRIQLDFNSYDGVINKAEDETGSDIFFRRARVQLDGHVKDWGYKASYNLTEGGSIDVLFVSYEGWGKMAELTFGQQKEGFGLEDTGSSKWTTAIERSLPSNAFSVGKNLGIALRGANDRFTYSVGVFKESVDAATNSLDYAITSRFVVRPLRSKDRLVHLGLGASRRHGDFDSLGARLGVVGGSARTANKVEAEYDGAVADESTAWNLEAAAIFGSLHFMAEYFDGDLQGQAGAPDLGANGYYVQAGWVVTGQRRSYKTSNATLDKVVGGKKSGAWEVFARYDRLDVTGSGKSRLIDIDGGEGRTISLGMNWYSRSHAKVAVNYIRAETEESIGGRDDGDALALRLQFLF